MAAFVPTTLTDKLAPASFVAGGAPVNNTSKWKLLLAVKNPSLTVNVIVAAPIWSVTGAMITVRFVPIPVM